MRPDESEADSSYWGNFAPKFGSVGPPFAPGPEDVIAMEAAAAECSARLAGSPLQVLLLGVTPRLARMKLPDGSCMLAVDRSEAMVRQVWSPDVGRRAVVGDWFSLPVGDASQDAVIGDGVPICVRYPDGLRQLVCSVRHVLRADGAAIIRCFVQHDHPEDPARVMQEIAACASFHHFKMRLLMALQPNARDGVAVNDVYRYWSSHKVDVPQLAARTGWDRQDIDTIELHNGPNIVHTFPTRREIEAVVAPYFGNVSVRVPAYSLGERCPLLVLRP